MTTRDTPHQSMQEMALACLQRNDLAGAESLYERILESSPQDSKALFMLGIVHARQGQLQKSEQRMRKAIAIDPGMPEAWLKLGQLHELQGRFATAEASLLHALSLKPALHDAHESLGRVYTGLCRYEEAIEQFRNVLDQAPNQLAALDGLAGALRLSGRATAAYEVCTRALALAPDDARVHISMGRICHNMGKLEEAQDHYRKALQQIPDSAQAIFGEAEVLERLGQPEQALVRLQPLLSGMDGNAELLLLYAKICTRLKPDEPVIERLEKALGNDTLNITARERIHFLLGQLLDRDGRYDAAFGHYQAANRSVWQRLGDEKYQDPIDDIIATFDVLDYSSLPRADAKGVNPVFIVGMPRSGSSLVEQILASHPQVYGAGELNTIGIVAAGLGYAKAGFNPDAAAIQTMARRTMDGLKQLAGDAKFVTDKMPQNFLYLGLIALLFPDAKIIHTKRDPIDTCLSCYFQNFSGANRFSYDLEQLGRYYRRYEKLMDYWRQLGITFLDVQYEDLVADLEGVSRRMTGFCGMEWDDACLSYHESKRVTATASYDQVNKPIYTSSIGRWKHYKEYLEPLRKALTGSE